MIPGIVEISNLGLTFLLFLEVAQIKRSLEQAENIEVKPPAPIQMVMEWKA